MQGQPRGHSLSEYGLVAALVLVVSMVGVRLLGQTLNLNFGSMIPGPTPTNAIGKSPQVAGTAGVHSSLDKESEQASEEDDGPADEILSSNPDEERSEAPGTVQTAGGLGDNERQLQSYSGQLMAFAAKFKDESPELYNQIIALGRAGKTMGQSLTKYEGAPDKYSSNMQNAILAMSAPPGSVAAPSDISAEGQATVSSLKTYSDIWKGIQTSSDYQQLSPEDQAVIVKLAQSSLKVTKGALDPNYGNKNKVGGLQNLITNSDQMIQCGSGNQCN